MGKLALGDGEWLSSRRPADKLTPANPLAWIGGGVYSGANFASCRADSFLYPPGNELQLSSHAARNLVTVLS
jgi:hypothetical protein